MPPKEIKELLKRYNFIANGGSYINKQEIKESMMDYPHNILLDRNSRYLCIIQDKEAEIYKLKNDIEILKTALEKIANPVLTQEFADQRNFGVSWERIYEDFAADTLKKLEGGETNWAGKKELQEAG